jgi:hypothetical protein
MASLSNITPLDPSRLLDPQHWREKAEEARQQLNEMMDPIAKETMQRVVEAFEEMALAIEKKRQAH